MLGRSLDMEKQRTYHDGGFGIPRQFWWRVYHFHIEQKPWLDLSLRPWNGGLQHWTGTSLKSWNTWNGMEKFAWYSHFSYGISKNIPQNFPLIFHIKQIFRLNIFCLIFPLSYHFFAPTNRSEERATGEPGGDLEPRGAAQRHATRRGEPRPWSWSGPSLVARKQQQHMGINSMISPRRMGIYSWSMLANLVNRTPILQKWVYDS